MIKTLSAACMVRSPAMASASSTRTSSLDGSSYLSGFRTNPMTWIGLGVFRLTMTTSPSHRVSPPWPVWAASVRLTRIIRGFGMVVGDDV